MSKLFDQSQIKVLHIEPTTVCNAACPQCAREHVDLYNDLDHRAELSVAQLQNLFDNTFISNLEKMFMCGNFGDPAAGKHTVEIYHWFRHLNPDIVLGMNTNGSLRSASWWSDLAKIMSMPKDYVVFSIDGLKDTNHIYRKNVDWNRLMTNVQSFIDAGGQAHWDMLIFDHNEHQVDEARDMARSLGFKWFRAKVSKRFDWLPVSYLRPPKAWARPNVDHVQQISCHALREQSLYVTATGKVLPCCFFGAGIFQTDEYRDRLLDTENFSGLTESWHVDPHPNCVRHCGSDHVSSSFDKQWQMEVSL